MKLEGDQNKSHGEEEEKVHDSHPEKPLSASIGGCALPPGAITLPSVSGVAVMAMACSPHPGRPRGDIAMPLLGHLMRSSPAGGGWPSLWVSESR